MKQLILILIILTAGYVCHAQLRPPIQTDTENRGRWTLFHMSTGRDSAQFSNNKCGRPDRHDSTVTMPRTRAGSAIKSER